MEASTLDAARALDDVAPELIEKFRKGAEGVLKSKDAVSALAAALAVISGCTKVTKRSLLSSRENMTTYVISKSDEEIRGKSFVYVIMKKILGDDKAEAAIAKVAFSKDKKALVFDVSSEYDALIEEKWFNTKSLEMKVCTELPELEEERSGGFERNGGGGGGGGGFRRGGGDGGRDRRGGGGGGFGGGRGRGGRGGSSFGGRGGRDRDSSRGGFGGGGGDNKRKFDNASAAMSSKKIKFDD